MAEESERSDSADWLQDLSSEDEFESLRRKSARTSAIYEEMDTAAEPVVEQEGRGLLGQFSAGQRLILAILVLLNVVAFGCGLLVLTEVITPFN